MVFPWLLALSRSLSKVRSTGCSLAYEETVKIAYMTKMGIHVTLAVTHFSNNKVNLVWRCAMDSLSSLIEISPCLCSITYIYWRFARRIL